METHKSKNTFQLTDEENALVQLFQQLTIEQCVELFKKNYDNYRSGLKNKLYVVIGAKFVWGEDYKPNKNYIKSQNQK